MNVVIVGWYGTETLGDRAILAGILSILYQETTIDEVQLGSLYPFFSHRTLDEDHSFWRDMTGADIRISVFDSANPRKLRKAIDSGDVLLMGGGPLMHIPELHMIEYAFRYAKSRGKRTGVFGCGVGPIFKKAFQKPLLRILSNCDIAVLRDTASKLELESIAADFSWSLDVDLEISLDPAVFPCHFYRSSSIGSKSLARHDQICINLREFPVGYAEESSTGISADRRSIEFVRSLAIANPQSEVILQPMHYFHVGDDDRYFLNRTCREVNVSNIRVQQEPLSLHDTLHTFSRSRYCVGMRFHSVVFQTIVLGRNLVLDYTQPGKGKIAGFLRELDGWEFYEPRYANVQIESLSYDELPPFEESFEVSGEIIERAEKTYTDAFRKLL